MAGKPVRVQRITLDADLGLIELKTGPGGDGDYVLLPLHVPPTAARFLSVWQEPDTKPEAPTVTSIAGRTGEIVVGLDREGHLVGPEESDSFVKEDVIKFPEGGTYAIDFVDGKPVPRKLEDTGDSITAVGGWSVPKDQEYEIDYWAKNAKKLKKRKKSKKAKEPWFPSSVRGGIKYPAKRPSLPNPLNVFATRVGKYWAIEASAYNIFTQVKKLEKAPEWVRDAASRMGYETDGLAIATIIKD